MLLRWIHSLPQFKEMIHDWSNFGNKLMHFESKLNASHFYVHKSCLRNILPLAHVDNTAEYNYLFHIWRRSLKNVLWTNGKDKTPRNGAQEITEHFHCSQT